MDELTLLRTLRDDVPETTAEQLDPALRRLEDAIAGNASRRRLRPPRARWVMAAAAAAAILALVAGNVTMTVRSAHASELLRSTAAGITGLSDPTPGPGQYLLSHTRANWPVSIDGGAWTPDEQTIDIYIPADRDDEWVLYRDWGELLSRASQSPRIEILRAENGEFSGDGASWGDWSQPIRDIPDGTGPELLTYFDAQYAGGSMSRDEDNFERIVDVLRTGLVPASTRAGLYEALALIPGVTTTDGVANLDGEKGVAIGRTEPLRGGIRSEVIIDTSTGLVIGEREITTYAIFGLGYNETFSLTAINTSVVDEAPLAPAAG